MNKIKPFDGYSNTVVDKYPDERIQKSIFVSIVSYRDENVINTIKSLFLNAKRPENIYVSLVVSAIGNHESWSLNLDREFAGLGTVYIKKFECSDKHRIGELRSIADSSYNREDYYMIVNSSSEFDPHWDDILIKQYSTISKFASQSDFLFTADPRGYLPHDEVVDGYVYFTNHKTRISFQREEYDGSYIPTSGFSPFVSDPSEFSNESEHLSTFSNNMKFLQTFGFPKFSNRKFVKNEVLATPTGLSSKFIFCSAKNYFKANKIKNYIIDEEDFNFISFINLINSGFTLLTPRWLPIYNLYWEGNTFDVKKSPKDFYDESSLLESSSYIEINKIIGKIVDDENYEKRKYIDDMLCIDWEIGKFKIRDKFIRDSICEFANLSVISYNFSTGENSLHWNRRNLDD